MRQYRFALQTVVAKEAKAYGFAVVVWSTGSFLLVERDEPTAGAILVFVAGILAGHWTGVLIAFGKPTRTWHLPEQREYVWSAFHALPIAVAVLLAWALAAGLHGTWAYLLAPLLAVLAYQLLLGLEALLLSAEDRVSTVTEEMAPDR